MRSSASSPPPPLGRNRIGRYDIIYPISQGGMASVYAGRLSGIAGFQRLVAIKVVHSHLASEDAFIKMFLDEARLSAGIHHPNVGEVFEVGEDAGIYYMVAELILGQSLRAVFRRADQRGLNISPVFCARIATDVCGGLHAAHELKGLDGESLGLVHRDVSPRNILLTYDGFVKLIDFGVAYAQGRISHTDVGTLKGKIGYMSPEQLRCEPLDRRSDIFSLGVLLYQIVTGKQPFHGRSDMERLNKIMKYQFDKPSTLVRRLDPQLEEIILKAMAERPDERYAAATDMAADLSEYLRRVDSVPETGALTKMMNTLFQEEQDYHREKVRAHQKKESVPEEHEDKEIDESFLKKTHPELPRSIFKKKSEDKYGRLKKLSFALLAVLIVLGGAVWGISTILFSVEGDPGIVSSSDVGAPLTEDTTGKNTAGLARAGETKGNVGAAKSPGAERDDADITSVVSISFALFPKDAAVLLDGIVLAPGTNEVLLSADGSSHRLQISAEGYWDEIATVTADRDRVLEISLVQKTVETKKSSKRQRRNTPKFKKKAARLEASPYR